MSLPTAANPHLTEKESHTKTAEFVQQAPNSNYSLDELSPSPDAAVRLCRTGTDGQRSCVEIHDEVTKVFELMQKQGFFCTLPTDPSRTWIECEQLNKVLARA
ncbi:hypothetical protein T439DRAFT_359738 [Meredithblackwellia eburnea MCA 4105]